MRYIITSSVVAGYRIKSGIIFPYNTQIVLTEEEYFSEDVQMGIKLGWLKVLAAMKNIPRKLNLVKKKPQVNQNIIHTLPHPRVPDTNQMKKEIAEEVKNQVRAMVPEISKALVDAMSDKVIQGKMVSEVKTEEKREDVPLFIPSISHEGMNSAIQVEKTSEEKSLDDILAELKKMKK